MLSLLTLVTLAYIAVVVVVRRVRRAGAAAMAAEAAPELTGLPPEDQPPESAVGWPPTGSRFESYVGDGIAELDAFLEDGYAT